MERCPIHGTNGFYFAGNSFRTPKKNDDKTWEVVTYLLKNGLTYSYCCGGIGKPTTMKGAKKLVSTIGTGRYSDCTW